MLELGPTAGMAGVGENCTVPPGPDKPCGI